MIFIIIIMIIIIVIIMMVTMEVREDQKWTYKSTCWAWLPTQRAWLDQTDGTPATTDVPITKTSLSYVMVAQQTEN